MVSLPVQPDQPQLETFNKYKYAEFAGYSGEARFNRIVYYIVSRGLATAVIASLKHQPVGGVLYVGATRLADETARVSRTYQLHLSELVERNLLRIYPDQVRIKKDDGSYTTRRVMVKDFDRLFDLAHEYYLWEQSSDYIAPVRENVELLHSLPDLCKKLVQFDRYRWLLRCQKPGRKSREVKDAVYYSFADIESSAKDSVNISSPYRITGSNHSDTSDSNQHKTIFEEANDVSTQLSLQETRSEGALACSDGTSVPDNETSYSRMNTGTGELPESYSHVPDGYMILSDVHSSNSECDEVSNSVQPQPSYTSSQTQDVIPSPAVGEMPDPEQSARNTEKHDETQRDTAPVVEVLPPRPAWCKTDLEYREFVKTLREYGRKREASGLSVQVGAVAPPPAVVDHVRAKLAARRVVLGSSSVTVPTVSIPPAESGPVVGRHRTEKEREELRHGSVKLLSEMEIFALLDKTDEARRASRKQLPTLPGMVLVPLSGYLFKLRDRSPKSTYTALIPIWQKFRAAGREPEEFLEQYLAPLFEYCYSRPTIAKVNNQRQGIRNFMLHVGVRADRYLAGEIWLPSDVYIDFKNPRRVLLLTLPVSSSTLDEATQVTSVESAVKVVDADADLPIAVGTDTSLMYDESSSVREERSEYMPVVSHYDKEEIAQKRIEQVNSSVVGEKTRSVVQDNSNPIEFAEVQQRNRVRPTAELMRKRLLREAVQPYKEKLALRVVPLSSACRICGGQVVSYLAGDQSCCLHCDYASLPYGIENIDMLLAAIDAVPSIDECQDELNEIEMNS